MKHRLVERYYRSQRYWRASADSAYKSYTFRDRLSSGFESIGQGDNHVLVRPGQVTRIDQYAGPYREIVSTISGEFDTRPSPDIRYWADNVEPNLIPFIARCEWEFNQQQMKKIGARCRIEINAALDSSTQFDENYKDEFTFDLSKMFDSLVVITASLYVRGRYSRQVAVLMSGIVKRLTFPAPLLMTYQTRHANRPDDPYDTLTWGIGIRFSTVDDSLTVDTRTLPMFPFSPGENDDACKVETKVLREPKKSLWRVMKAIFKP